VGADGPPDPDRGIDVRRLPWEPPHVGRGGWTWYTGSAGWMYQAGMESILGFRLRGTTLTVEPCIPRAWPGYEINFRYHSATYEIVVGNPHGISRGVASIELDGQLLPDGGGIPLADDGVGHRVWVVLGGAATPTRPGVITSRR
jgi:cyclic beta-1,2-glucan synthetase